MNEIIDDINSFSIDDNTKKVLESNTSTSKFGRNITYIKSIENRLDYPIKVDIVFSEGYNLIFNFLKTKKEYKGYTKQKMCDEIFGCWNKLPTSDMGYLLQKFKLFRYNYYIVLHQSKDHIVLPVTKGRQTNMWLHVPKNSVEIIEGIKNDYFVEPPTSGLIFSILFVWFVHTNEYLNDFKQVFGSCYNTVNNYINMLPINFYNENKDCFNDFCEGSFFPSRVHVVINYLLDLVNFIEKAQFNKHIQYGYYYTNLLIQISRIVVLINGGIEFIKSNDRDFDILKFNELTEKIKPYSLKDVD